MTSTGVHSRAAVTKLLKPRSVAIVGVSSRSRTVGRVVLKSLEVNGFEGDIYLVGRSREAIDGRPMLQSIEELPPRVDLAVLALPAVGVKEAVDGCVRRGVRSAVVFASGFAETGNAAEQEEVARAAAAGGLALLGPNCIGFTNNVDGLTVHMFRTEKAKRWNAGDRPGVALVGQSGGLLGHLQRSLERRGVPLPYVVNTGNEAGVDVAEFLTFFIDDPATRVIALYCEAIKRPGDFLAGVRRSLMAGKPVVVLHPGRGKKAQSAARSHTGAVVGDYQLMANRIEDTGALLLGALDEFMDVIQLLERWPQPPSKGVGLLTTSGAYVALAHDMAEEIDVELPELTRSTVESFEEALPAFGTYANPLDTTAAASPEATGKVARALSEDPNVGILLMCISLTSPEPIRQVDRALDGIEKPSVLVIFGDAAESTPEVLRAASKGPWVFWRSADRALRAVSQYCRYGRLLARGRGTPPAPLSGLPLLGRGTQTEWRSKELLHAAGIRVPEGQLAVSPDDAAKVAARIGYPVALKVQAATLLHKTEAGAVALDVRDETSLRDAWRRVTSRVESGGVGVGPIDGVLVERMAGDGVELMIGAKRDVRWGPALVVGLGGVWVEALGDVQLLPISATTEEVGAALSRLRSARLLEGFRDAPPADVDAVSAAVTALARLMVAVPEITEIDVNPLVAHPRGRGATALDALVVTVAGPGH